MNGVHDMGGMHGFGPVEPEPNEPVFHADGRGVRCAHIASIGDAGPWNIDQSRFAREQLPPADYLARATTRSGWRAREPADRARAGRRRRARGRPGAAAGPALKRRCSPADDVERALPAAGSAGRPRRRRASSRRRPRARRNMHPHGHTRLPRYARGSRRRRGGPRLPRLSGHQSRRRGREPAVALHGACSRPRTVGRRRRSRRSRRRRSTPLEPLSWSRPVSDVRV